MLALKREQTFTHNGERGNLLEGFFTRVNELVFLQFVLSEVRFVAFVAVVQRLWLLQFTFNNLEINKEIT